MIYLLDSPYTETSHSKYLIDIITQHTQVPIKHIEIENNPTISKLSQILYSVLEVVIPCDIVLCAWAIPANEHLDQLFEELTQCCYVVAAAGNFKQPIENYTPARTNGVITVGTLNKEGLVAALSNYSNTKEVVWIPGTNYNVGWKNSSGTSISAALYSAFLAESLDKKDVKLLDKLIQDQKDRVFAELHHNHS